MGCKDGSVHSTITCTFDFRGAHACERERERKTERMREEENIDILDIFLA